METPHYRVLVVDDELLIRWSISEVLMQEGHDVIEASDAEGARRELTSPAGPPDVALLDLRLPDSHDLSLLGDVRRLAPSTPVVLMTAYGTPEITAEALRLGASAVMHKPFDIHAVEPVLRAAVGGGGKGPATSPM